MASRELSSYQKESTSEMDATRKNQQTRRGKQAARPDQIAEEVLVGQRRHSRTLTHEQISERAKAIWQRSGCPVGQDVKNWLEAESQLKSELGVG